MEERKVFLCQRDLEQSKQNEQVGSKAPKQTLFTGACSESERQREGKCIDM